MSMVSISARPVFDLSAIDFASIDDLDVPAYEPTPTDEAWRLGFETELAGERAAISSRDGYTAAEHLAFANGQRAARERVVAGEAKPKPISHEELLGRLLVLAAAYDAEGDEFGRYVSDVLRDHATEAEGYGSRAFKEFDARRESYHDDLRRQCDECNSRRYEDVVL